MRKTLALLCGLLAFAFPVVGQMVPGSRSLNLDANGKPLGPISLASPNWVDALNDSNLSPLAQSASATGSQILVRVATGNDATGQRGTTLPYKTLAAAVATAQSYDHILVQGGVYSYAGTLTVPVGLDHLTVEFDGAKIIAQNTAASVADSHKIDVNGDDCTIINAEIDGNNGTAPYTGNSGDPQGTTIPDAGLITVAGKRCKVLGAFVHDTLSVGIRAVGDTSGLLVEDSTFTHCHAAFHAYSYGATVSGINVHDCTMLFCPDGGYRSTNNGGTFFYEHFHHSTVINTGAGSLGAEFLGNPVTTAASAGHQGVQVDHLFIRGYSFGYSINSTNGGHADHNDIANFNGIGGELVNSVNTEADNDHIDCAGGGCGYSLDMANNGANHDAYFKVSGSTIINANNTDAVRAFAANQIVIDDITASGQAAPINVQFSTQVTVKNCRLTQDNTTVANPCVLIQVANGITNPGYHLTANEFLHKVAGNTSNVVALFADSGQTAATVTDAVLLNNRTDATFCGASFLQLGGATYPGLLQTGNLPNASGSSTQYGFVNTVYADTVAGVTNIVPPTGSVINQGATNFPPNGVTVNGAGVVVGNDPRFRFVYTPEMFGAPDAYSATVDDTNAVQAAIVAAQSLTTPGIVRLNRQYRIAQPNVLQVTMSGVVIDGIRPTNGFTLDFASGNGLTFAPPTAPTTSANTVLYNCILRDFTVTALQPMTSGAAVYTNWTNNLQVLGVKIGTQVYSGGRMNVYDGLALLNEGACRVERPQVCAHHYGMIFSGTDVGLSFDGTHYDGLVTGEAHLNGDGSAGSRGVYVGGGTGGIKLNVAGNVTGFENGVWVDKALTGTDNRELFIDGDFFIDSNIYNGVWIDAGLAIFSMRGGWACGNGRQTYSPRPIPAGNGYGICGNLSNCNFHLAGVYCYMNGSDGIHMAAGNVIVSGGAVYQNGVNGAGSGIYCYSLAAPVITGCLAISNATLDIDVTACTSPTVVGNTVSTGTGNRINYTPGQFVTVLGNTGTPNNAQTFNGPVTTQGPSADIHVGDRTTPDGWDVYATGGTLYDFNKNGNVFGVDLNGGVFLNPIPDASAANNRLYLSSQTGKPSFKDGNGTVHTWY